MYIVRLMVVVGHVDAQDTTKNVSNIQSKRKRRTTKVCLSSFAIYDR